MKNRGHFTGSSKRIMPNSDHGDMDDLERAKSLDTSDDRAASTGEIIGDDVRLAGSGRRPTTQIRKVTVSKDDAKGLRMSGYYSIDQKIVDEFNSILGRMNNSEQIQAKRHFSTNVRKTIVASVAPKRHRTAAPVKTVRLTVTIPRKVLEDLVRSQDPASLKSQVSAFVEATSGYVADEMSDTIARFNRAYKRD